MRRPRSVSLIRHAPVRTVLRFYWWSWVAGPILRARHGRRPIVPVQRLVFICSGNICRSPYAEEKTKASGFPAISFGLCAGRDDVPPRAAVAAASARGVDISRHRSRPLAPGELRPSDLILLMEPSMQAETIEMIGNGARVVPLGLWPRFNRPRPYIPDPYGLPEPVFAFCYALIDLAVEAIVEEIGPGMSRRDRHSATSEVGGNGGAAPDGGGGGSPPSMAPATPSTSRAEPMR